MQKLAQRLNRTPDNAGVAHQTAGSPGYRESARAEMLEFLPDDSRSRRILEIGCGNAGFSGQFSFESEVWGIEPYAPAAEVAASRLHKVLSSTFEAARASLPTSYFDLVICNDVIEHMIDHDSFLHAIQDDMIPGGVLIGSVPNVRHYRNLFNLLVARDWEYEEDGILDRTHFRFFTMRSLRRSLEQVGFTVEHLKGINGRIPFGWRRWDLSYWLFAHGLIGLTGGPAADIRHMQFGFRAVLGTDLSNSPEAPHRETARSS